MEITRFTFFLPQFVLAMLSYLAGYYTPPRLRFIYVALQAAMFFSVLYYVPSSTAGNDYQWATACFFLMMKSGDFFLLSSPYDDFYLNGQPKYAELSFWGRIYWAFNLSFSGRYSGTSYQVAYLPPGPSPNSSRIQFLKQSINLLCLHAFCSYFFLGDPYLMTRGVEGTRPRDLPFHQRAFYCWLNCLNAIFGISFPNVVLCFFTFGLWGSKEDARPICGNWGDCWSIRRFWGRVWHQMLRRPLQAYGRWLAWDVIGFQRGGLGSNYTQVYTAFFICAVGHWVGNYAIDHTRYWPDTMVFFMAQAVAITGEDFVIWLARNKLGIKPLKKDKEEDWGVWRYVGYCWVALWFAFMMPLFLEELVQAGMMDDLPGIILGKKLLGSKLLRG